MPTSLKSTNSNTYTMINKLFAEFYSAVWQNISEYTNQLGQLCILYISILLCILEHILKKKCCMVFLNHFFIRWTLKTNKKGCAHTHNWVNKTFQSEWESPVILTTKNGVTDHFGQITFCCHQLCVRNTFLSTQLFDLNRISREKNCLKTQLL